MNTTLFNIQYNSVSKTYTVIDRQTGFRISFQSLEQADMWMSANEDKAGKVKEPTFTQDVIKEMIKKELESIKNRIELVKRNVKYLDDVEVNVALHDLELMQELIYMQLADLAA